MPTLCLKSSAACPLWAVLGEDDEEVGEAEAAELDDERPQRAGFRLARKLDLALVKRERLDGAAPPPLLPPPAPAAAPERSSSGMGNAPGLAGIRRGLLHGSEPPEEVPTELLGDMSPTDFTKKIIRIGHNK